MQDSKRKSQNRKLREVIIKIYNESNKVYGAPKTRIELMKNKLFKPKNLSIQL